MRILFALLAVLGITACGDTLGPNPDDVTFDASLGIDLAQMTRLSTGVYVQTTTQGSGAATVKLTDHVTVLYQGWLANGKLFDQGTISDALTSGGYYNFVPGFVDGMVGMKVGEVRKVVIPADQGYGPDANGKIPGNSVLVFQLTLISIP